MAITLANDGSNAPATGPNFSSGYQLPANTPPGLRPPGGTQAEDTRTIILTTGSSSDSGGICVSSAPIPYPYRIRDFMIYCNVPADLATFTVGTTVSGVLVTGTWLSGKLNQVNSIFEQQSNLDNAGYKQVPMVATAMYFLSMNKVIEDVNTRLVLMFQPALSISNPTYAANAVFIIEPLPVW